MLDSAMRRVTPAPTGAVYRNALLLLGDTVVAEWSACGAFRAPATAPGSASAPAVSTLRVNDATLSCLVVGELRCDLDSRLRALGFGSACRDAASSTICAYVQWGDRFDDFLAEDHVCALWDGRARGMVLSAGPAATRALRVRWTPPVDRTPDTVRGAARPGAVRAV